MDPFKNLPEGYKTSKEDLVSENEAKRDKNSFTAEGPKRVKGIVDLDDITNKIIIFLDYIETDEIKELEKDEKAFVSHMMEKFVDNFNDYFTIFNTLLETKNRKENTLKILQLIETLNEVKKGKKNEDLEYLKFQEAKATEYKVPKKLWRK